jgi:ribose transport system permease protein
MTGLSRDRADELRKLGAGAAKESVRAPWFPMLGAVAVGGICLALLNSNFGSNYNLFTIFQTMAVYAVIGLSQMVVLSIGEMSLAVGGIGGVVTIVVGYLFQVQHWPASAAIVMGLLAGCLCGLLNGIVIARSSVNAFVITLGTGTAFGGLAYAIPKAMPYGHVPSVLLTLGQGRASFVSYLVPIAFVVTIAVAAVFHWSPTGRALLAIGGNRQAAALSGISELRATLVAHTASGLLAGVAGVMYIGVLASADPNTGTDWLITSFAIPIIGGTALVGGEVSPLGCLVAATVIAGVNDALIVLSISNYAVELGEGVLIFVAVASAGLLGKLSNSGLDAALMRKRDREVD